MKLPIAVTIAIVAAASLWGLHEERLLVALREEHRKTAQEAASIGVSTDLTRTFTPTKGSLRQREHSILKAREFANELVGFANEMKALEDSGEEPDAAMKRRLIEMLDTILSFKGAELKALIGEIRNHADLDDETRKNLISFSIMLLANEHPQAALAIFTESADLMEGNPMGSHVISSALTRWAQEQPLEAVEWIKSNSAKHRDLVTMDAKQSAIAGAAQSGYGLAFQLAGEIEVPLTDGTVLHSMAGSATTTEKRSEFLSALRQNAALQSDRQAGDQLLKSGTDALFRQLAKDGYAQSVEWLESAKLAPEERAAFIGSLDYHTTKADTGKWLDWISTHGGNDESVERTTNELVGNWTRNDYRAAGEWLAKAPSGPLRNAAVIAYVQTVAPYDTEVAVRWADTLPADHRSKAIHGIHSSLGQRDQDAAAKFAKQHGLGEE
jgi:hypothetical protein